MPLSNQTCPPPRRLTLRLFLPHIGKSRARLLCLDPRSGALRTQLRGYLLARVPSGVRGILLEWPNSARRVWLRLNAQVTIEVHLNSEAFGEL